MARQIAFTKLHCRKQHGKLELEIRFKLHISVNRNARLKVIYWMTVMKAIQNFQFVELAFFRFECEIYYIDAFTLCIWSIVISTVNPNWKTSVKHINLLISVEMMKTTTTTAINICKKSHFVPKITGLPICEFNPYFIAIQHVIKVVKECDCHTTKFNTNSDAMAHVRNQLMQSFLHTIPNIFCHI